LLAYLDHLVVVVMVRCINSLLTSIGGPATSAHLNSPTSVAVDSVYNLVYITDPAKNVIRVVNRTNNIITNFAGTNSYPGGYSGDGAQATSAHLDSANDVAVDKVRSLVYIADTANSCVRVVNRHTGIITTFAGGGSTSGLSKF
jgi:DNA-binding beta-propeller fold protein YncE